MPFDDDDSKIRRNLVVYSALVLTLAWLELPLGMILELVLPEGFSRPPDYKLWTLGFVILAYLGIRFSFAAEARNFRDSAERTAKNLQLYKCRKLVYFASYLYTQIGLDSHVIPGGFDAFLKRIDPRIIPEGEVKLKRPRLQFAISIREGEPWNYDTTVKVVWGKQGRFSAVQSGGIAAQVEIQGLVKFIALIWARTHAWTYTEHAIQYLAPIFFGLAATLVLWSRVVQAYMLA